tara:strand:- start:123 stop:437 length:315 start_codon:yes stop_codon:yes gene_type:complete
MSPFSFENRGQEPSGVSVRQASTAVLSTTRLSALSGIKQQSCSTQVFNSQLTIDKLFFNDFPVGQFAAEKAVPLLSILSHVGVVQHSLPSSGQNMQTVEIAFAG